MATDNVYSFNLSVPVAYFNYNVPKTKNENIYWITDSSIKQVDLFGNHSKYVEKWKYQKTKQLSFNFDDNTEQKEEMAALRLAAGIREYAAWTQPEQYILNLTKSSAGSWVFDPPKITDSHYATTSVISTNITTYTPLQYIDSTANLLPPEK